GDFRMGGRPLWAQGRTDRFEPVVRNIHPCRRLREQSRAAVLCWPVSASAASFPTSWPSMPNPRPVICGRHCPPIGGAIPGFVAAAFVSKYGWQILFQLGGIVPIVIAVAALFGLPESIKYMALHESQRRKMEALIAPSVLISSGSRLRSAWRDDGPHP